MTGLSRPGGLGYKARQLPIDPQLEDARGEPPIRLSHAQALQDLSGGQAGLEGHLAVVLPRRQDRRRGPQRRGQVDAAQDHGRRARGLHRRGLGRGGHQASATCRRSRSSTPAKDVLGNAMEGVAEKKALVDRYNELAANYSDETAEEMAKLQDEIEAQGLWDLDTQVEQALDALRCPPGDAEVEQALGRREAARRADQAAARQARHPAAGRADQPPGRRVGGLAGALSQGLRRLRHAGHPRPLLPRQHHGVDAGARSRAGRALQGQLLELAGAEGQAPRGREGPGGGQAAHAQARAGMDPLLAQGAAGQVQGAHPGLRQAGRGGRPRADRQGADPDPARTAAGRHGGGGRGPVEGVRRQAADRQPVLQAAARRHRRRDRPQRRRQDHAVQDDHRPGEAGRRHASGSATPSSSATSTRAATT